VGTRGPKRLVLIICDMTLLFVLLAIFEFIRGNDIGREMNTENANRSKGWIKCKRGAVYFVYY
jgi:hypothetical protein